MRRCSLFLSLLAEAQDGGPWRRKTAGKLPKEVVPHAYKIALVPDLAQFLRQPAGRLLDSRARCRSIRSTSAGRDNYRQRNDISIVRATVDGARSRVEIDRQSQIVNGEASAAAGRGRHMLVIEYSGTILTHQEGLFYSTYDTPAGQRWVLATDLEPAGARRIFPGWDEPAFKATFELSVTVPANFRALSNMPVAAERADGRRAKS